MGIYKYLIYNLNVLNEEFHNINQFFYKNYIFLKLY